MAHPVDLLVDVGFLLDIGVGAWDVGLRLVIVVVGDEILDRIVGEEALELAVELRRQGLVRRQDQRRTLDRLDHLGHGEGFAGSGDPEQHLVALVRRDALDQLLNRRRLVALGLVVGDDAEGAPALRLVRPRRPVRRPRRAVADVGVTLLEQRLQRFDGGGRAGEAAGMIVGTRALEAALRHFAEAVGLGLDQRGIEERGEMVAERMQLGPRGLSAGGAGGFLASRFFAGGLFGGGHGRNMGRISGRGKGAAFSTIGRRARCAEGSGDMASIGLGLLGLAALG